MTRPRVPVAVLLAAVALVAVFVLLYLTRSRGVVIYSALDSKFVQPVLDEFAHQTGSTVRSRFVDESTTAADLMNDIIAEPASGRMRCDVFWNNEILSTLGLADRGLLDPYKSPGAEAFPARFRSLEGTWYGWSARARVLIVNTKLVPTERRPTSIRDLADPKWRGRVGIAKPLSGTAATHAACLFALWGEKEARDFFHRLKHNVMTFESGNKEVARWVAEGNLDFGLTDSDDAIAELHRTGRPVAIVYPDQQPGGIGTLFIPNTLSIIHGSRRLAKAQRLVDYLLSAEAQQQLAAGESGQIPLRTGLKGNLPPGIETPETVRPMQVDFRDAAKVWDTTIIFLADEFRNSPPHSD